MKHGKQPATPGQLAYLESLGIAGPTTKSEAEAAIAQAKLRILLQRHGYRLDADGSVLAPDGTQLDADTAVRALARAGDRRAQQWILEQKKIAK
jgi:hypothetical protein